MTTYFFGANNVVLTLCLCLGLSACQSEDFYQKEYLENPYKVTTPDAGSTIGGTDGGTVAGSTTSGSTDGGTVAGSTTSGSTDGGTVAGSTTSGSTDGGTVAGSTTSGSTDGGTVAGSTTSGSTDGGTVGGVVYENREEIFTQSAEVTRKLDILWVIDNSGSMADDQTALGQNFDAFIGEFIQRDVDFKMAITTTDPRSGRQGVMISGSDTKLTSSKAKSNPSQFMNDFKNLVKVGTSGSGNEQGLAGASVFKNNYKNSFFREDAYFAIVIVSDEEDSSPNSVESYVANLQAVKANPGFVKIYSIVDLDNSNRGSGITTGSLRYQKASNLTSGTKAEIDGNWYQNLLDMGESIINLLDSFALAAAPVLGSVEVYVDGVLISSGYSYDSSSHSIKFESGYLPPAGSTIRVTYKVVK
jgi:hypothetical protein